VFLIDMKRGKYENLRVKKPGSLPQQAGLNDGLALIYLFN